MRSWIRHGTVRPTPGEVVEWLMAPVLKTGEAQASVGSNPTLSVFVPDPPLPPARGPLPPPCTTTGGGGTGGLHPLRMAQS